MRLIIDIRKANVSIGCSCYAQSKRARQCTNCSRARSDVGSDVESHVVLAEPLTYMPRASWMGAKGERMKLSPYQQWRHLLLKFALCFPLLPRIVFPGMA